MITKVIYSKNVGDSLRYILNSEKRAEVVLAKKISSMLNVDAIIRDFELQCQRRPTIGVKAVHIPMSFHIKDTATLEANYEQILSDWVERMEQHGYHFDQWVIGRHHDKDHKNPHFHFFGNLVLDNGQRAFIGNIGKAAKECSITITERWGLTSAKECREAKKQLAQAAKDLKAMSQSPSSTRSTTAQHSVGNNVSQHNFSENTADNTSVDNSSSGIMSALMDVLVPIGQPHVGTGGGSSDNSLDYYRQQEKKQKLNQRKGGRRL